MGLFSFFKRNKPEVLEEENPEIPKELFVDESEPSESNGSGLNHGETTLDSIYTFLQQDYEAKGYGDALTNAEESYKQENIELIALDLQILIEKARSYYEDMDKSLQYHLQTRSRAGLVDLVEELKTKKEVIEQHMDKIDEIENGMINRKGLSQRAILSYSRGFSRGLIAISKSDILNRQL